MQGPDPQNILVIHFGQLGDVVLAFPALRAIRGKFRDGKITVLSGRSTQGAVRLANVADEQIAVDRVALRDGNTARSVADILKLVKEVRGRRFDLVIDLHSLYETNLLGYLSGARQRLFANRDRRSLDRLSNYPIKPPKEDRSLHHADRYLAVLRPLWIDGVDRNVAIVPDGDTLRAADRVLAQFVHGERKLVGLFLGAGHHTRRWPIDNFVQTARKLADKATVLVLLGPEERELRIGLEDVFGDAASIVPELPLDVFVALLARLDVLVSGDTGPMHLAAAAGSGVVLLSQKGAPDIFRPLTEKLVVIDDRDFADIDVQTVARSVERLLSAA